MIAFEGGGGLSLMNADGSDPRLLEADASGRVGWSPDGNRIAFHGLATLDCAAGPIFTIHLDGTQLSEVANTCGGEAPAWSPDGTTLAFVITGYPWIRSDLVTVLVDGGPAQVIFKATDLAAFYPDPGQWGCATPGNCRLYAFVDWSPSGSQITFGASTPDGRMVSFSVNPDGTGAIGAGGGWMSPSPSGSWRVYVDDWGNGLNVTDGVSGHYSTYLADVWPGHPSWGALHLPAAPGIPRLGFQSTHLGSGTDPTVPGLVSWSPSGDRVCSYRPEVLTDSTEWAPVQLTSPTATQAKKTLRFGHRYVFRAAAVDCVGDQGAWSIGPTVTVAGDPVPLVNTGWAAPWIETTMSGAWGGTVQQTTVAASSPTLYFYGSAVALVGSRGPTYGKARVFIDGTYIRTINAHAKVTKLRQILFSTTWPTGGSHTIRIVNLATSGHPTIDVDGLVTVR